MALEIHPLLLGEAETDTSFLVWGLTPGDRMKAPLTAYLVLGGETPMLIDAGMQIPGGRIEEGFFAFTQSEDQTLSSQLGRFGLEPGDVGTLVATHLHSDHVGYVGELPEAKIVLQRKELQYAAAPYFPATVYGRQEIGELVGPLFERIEFVEGDVEIADGIRVSWTGGHTPGHQQVEIELESGLAIASGDTVYLLDPSLTMGIQPSLVTSVEENQRAIARLRREADYVLPAHEPSIHETYADGLK